MMSCLTAARSGARRGARSFVLGLVFGLCLAPAALADWIFDEGWREPLDGYDTPVALVRNAEGFVLHLYRSPSGRVMALYSWPEALGALAPEGPVAVLAPEGFDAKQIEARTEQGRFVEYARVGPGLLRDRLWHGQGDVPVGTLADILAAPAVTLRLTLNTAETVETRWSMAGAGLPVARALGLTLSGIAAGPDWEQQASQAMLAAMTACQYPKLDVTCVQKVTVCAGEISDNRDITAFEGCIAAQ